MSSNDECGNVLNYTGRASLKNKKTKITNTKKILQILQKFKK